MKFPTVKSLVCAGLLATVAVPLGGCMDHLKPVNPEPVHFSMIPELQTPYLTHKQRWTRMAGSIALTNLQVVEDWDRFWLVDDPIRLTDAPLP